MKWISVEEKLPEIDIDLGFSQVLVYCKFWGIYPAVIEYIKETKYTVWKDWSGNTVVPPTHWMPLPEPPKQYNK